MDSKLNITILGSISRVNADLLISAAQFYLKLLCPTRKCIELCIDIDEVIESVEMDGCIEMVTPRSFYCRLSASPSTGREIYLTLAHECVHLKQLITKQWIQTDEFDISLWEGKRYDDKKTGYWDAPWEIDAYGRELGLMMRWVETLEEKVRKKVME